MRATHVPMPREDSDMADIQKRVYPSGKVSYQARVRMRGYPDQTKSFARHRDAVDWAQETETLMKKGQFDQDTGHGHDRSLHQGGRS